MREPQQIVRISLPNDWNEEDRLRAGTLIRKTIIQRTREDNRDVDGNKFPGYSESYKNSIDFKIAGKDPNKVDLTLSGDMLDSIQTIKHGDGYIDIGFTSGTLENDKAAWSAASDNGPSRKFLGLTDSEKEIIFAEVETGRTQDSTGVSQNLELKIAKEDNRVQNLLKRFGIS